MHNEGIESWMARRARMTPSKIALIFRDEWRSERQELLHGYAKRYVHTTTFTFYDN